MIKLVIYIEKKQNKNEGEKRKKCEVRKILCRVDDRNKVNEISDKEGIKTRKVSDKLHGKKACKFVFYPYEISTS